MRPFPVLLVGNFLGGRGASRGVCEDLALHLEQAGWPVRRTSEYRAPLLRLADMLLAVWRTRRLCRAVQVDVYSGRAFRWAEAVSGLAGRCGQPVILTLHGGDLPGFAARQPRRVQRLLGRAAAITAPSPYLPTELGLLPAAHENAGGPAAAGTAARGQRPVCIIPNGIRLGLYPFRLRSAPEPRLVWLRAFHRIYAPEMAILAAGRLRTEFPGLRLTLVGPDKGDGSLAMVRERVHALAAESWISLAGPVAKDAVGAVLDQADIFLNTSRIDNAPVTLIEAMACGLCAVSTRVGGVPHLVRDGSEALLVPADDATAMAAAARTLLTRPELARRLSEAGRARAAAHDWATVVPQWEGLFRAVAR
jgi:glycosyltransferase involved in cell wall biosynthesis